ncbi:MAG TPA: AAA family ATPase [Polyangia bacterium]|nr:AAA family ATPase [Polyangia bacterium]
MKIAVVGGESTGRTSVAEAVAKKLGLPLVGNPRERVLAASGYHTLWEWQAATGGMVGLVEAQAAREREAARAVVDAGVLDQWCFVERWVWNRLSPEAAEALHYTVVQAAGEYARVLVTAPRLVGGSAPGRFRNRLHVAQSQRLLDGILREAVPADRVCFLPDGDLPQVVAAALAALPPGSP